MVEHGLIPKENGHLHAELSETAQPRPKATPTFLPTSGNDPPRGVFSFSFAPPCTANRAGVVQKKEANFYRSFNPKFNLVYE